MKPGSSPLAIFYRIIFRLTNTAHPAIKHGPSQGSSVVMHASLTAQKIEPEVVSWDKIRVPREWTISTKCVSAATSSVQSASKVIEDKGKATISFRKSSSIKPRLSTSSSTQSFMSDKEKNLESDLPPCSHPTLVHDPNTDCLWCEQCQSKCVYGYKRGFVLSDDNDFPVAKDFEIYTEDRQQRRQYWYQRQLDSKIEQSESARMMNWNNKATRAIQDQVLSQNEKLKRMQDTLKAIELHQRGDIHSVVSLLNKKVDSLSTNMQQLTSNLQHVPDQVNNSLQSQIQQSICAVSEGSEKKVIDSIQTVNEKVNTLCFSVSELEQNFPALTSAVNKIEGSQSDKSSISSSSHGPSPDWSKAITWAQVATMKSPLSQQKNDDKKIGMARLTEEAAESFMDTGESSTPPLQGTIRTLNFQPNFYKIECKSADEIREMIHGMIGWANTQVLQFGKHDKDIAGIIANGFVGILKEWWDVVPARMKDQIINGQGEEGAERVGGGTASLTAAIITEFIGTIDDEKRLSTLEFLRAQLCDMTKVKEYQCYMQKLLYNSGTPFNSTMKLRYVESFPTYFSNEYKKAMHGYTDADLTFGKLNQIITDTNQRLCLEKKARKEALRAEKYLGVKFCSAQIENQFGCPAPSSSQHKKYKKHSKRFKHSKFSAKWDHYSRDCPQKGQKAKSKAKVNFVQEHLLDEDHYVLISDEDSCESDIEFTEFTIAANQHSESSSDNSFSDSEAGYDSLPTFHCNMIRSSYEHPFIPPSSIVLKQKLDHLK
ncbi:hypothetical protein KI387_038798 [Taxus chinensis]|uniref:DUF7746 domain-containing protein n=1 Tax=Taxus chinensis TaxID=29808 RepID=A0AA38FAN0_TAXCH|nr:hypothetical protein KI387_038798 [Taxus chinensis]